MTFFRDLLSLIFWGLFPPPISSGPPFKVEG